MADEPKSGTRLGWEYPQEWTDEDGKTHLLGDLSPAMIEDIRKGLAKGWTIRPEVIEQLERQGVRIP
jgi:hypothetical protein